MVYYPRITKGKLLVDMSTVSPNFSRSIANKIAANQAHLLDAPVSGNPLMVEKGSSDYYGGW